MSVLKKFLKQEEGLETVEYAVMTALIVATLVIAIQALSGAISDRMDAVGLTISSIP